MSNSTKPLTNLHVLVRRGLEFCSCSVFLFDGEHNKIRGLFWDENYL